MWVEKLSGRTISDGLAAADDDAEPAVDVAEPCEHAAVKIKSAAPEMSLVLNTLSLPPDFGNATHRAADGVFGS